MTKKIDTILKEVLKNASPPKDESEFINKELKMFLEEIKKEIKKLKIDVEVFVGGSFAKETMVRKEKYDVDIFLRYSKKYSNRNLTDITKKILKNFKNKIIVHGSRDYFKLNISKKFYLEIVPVLKIKKSKEFENITDLSYSHVNYIKKKIKNKKILDEIKLAKIFCQINGWYGAESYIKGFSGYSLELLIVYYKTFENMLRKISNSKEQKIIIDIEKKYKDKKQILRDVNESKLESPIILIDPTHKYRNASAALSEDTLKKFKKEARKFLKSPSIKSFKPKKINLDLIKENSKKKKYEFILIETKTNKQEGDIAGTKLLKFYNHLHTEIAPYFDIKNKGFNYNGKKSARFFFVVKKKKELMLNGPVLKDKKNIKQFKKEHKTTFTKNGRIYAREKIRLDIKNFIQKWTVKNKLKVKDMYISGFGIVG